MAATRKRKKSNAPIPGQTPVKELNVPQTPKIKDTEIARPYKGIKNIKGAGEKIKLSKEEYEKLVAEVKKCKQDIIYFAENYFYIVSYKGTQVIELFPKQVEMLKSFVENNFSIILAARQSGKCIFHDSEITIRNKKTGKVESLTIGDFFKKFKIHKENN